MAVGKSIIDAVEKLKKGSMVVLFDGEEREGEADLIFHASFANPENIRRLRKDAGGLICLSLDPDFAKRLELPFYSDILLESIYSVKEMDCKKAAYGDKPAFAIPINHKGVYTGITDNDRSLTIRKMAELSLVKEGVHKKFVTDFYSPGHIFLLIGRGIENRKGHTELTLELARLAGMGGTMVLCEMLGEGKALSKSDAREYAKRNGFAFIEGKEIF